MTPRALLTELKALDWMDDAEIFEVLDKRNPNWSDFGR